MGVSWSASNVTAPAYNFFESADVLFAATSQGIFRTTDNGDAWTKISSNPFYKGVTIYNNIAFGADYYGVWKSSDEGITWVESGSFIDPQLHIAGTTLFLMDITGIFHYDNGTNVWLPVIIPSGLELTGMVTKDHKLFVSSKDNRLFVSENNGSSWQQIITDLKHVYNLGRYGNTLYAVTTSGTLISVDDGQTWSLLDLGTKTRLRTMTQLGDGSLIAGVFDLGMLRSQDHGLNWTLSNKGYQHLYIQELISNEDILYARSAIGVFKSTDEALTWQKINLPSEERPINISFVDNTIFIGTWSDGVMKSDDGVSWNFHNDGLNNSQISSLVSISDRLVAATSNGVYELPKDASTWVKTSTQNDIKQLFVSENQTELFGVTDSNEILLQNGIWWMGGFPQAPGHIEFLYKEQSWNQLICASGGETYALELETWKKAHDDLGIKPVKGPFGNYYSATHLGVVRTSSSGVSQHSYWSAISESLKVGSITGIVARNESIIVAFGPNGIWKRDLTPFFDYTVPSLAEFETGVGIPSAVQSFEIKGTLLNEPMIVTASESFEITHVVDDAGEFFRDTLFMNPFTENLTQKIYVRFNPKIDGTKSGYITVQGMEISKLEIPVAGNSLIMGASPGVERAANIYPNPAEDKITIQCSTPYSSIRVVNILGAVVIDRDVNRSDRDQELHMANLEDGMFVVELLESDVVVARVKVAKK